MVGQTLSSFLSRLRLGRKASRWAQLLQIADQVTWQSCWLQLQRSAVRFVPAKSYAQRAMGCTSAEGRLMDG